MNRKLTAGLLILLALLVISAAALAADPFRYAVKSVTLFEGESLLPEMIREGSAAEGGTLTFRSTAENVASVDAGGTSPR